MLNDYNQKRAKTTNFRLNNPKNQYQNSQTNNFRDIYINQSPIYYNQYRYEQEEPHSYIEQIHYIQNQKKQEGDYFYKDKNLQKTMKNLNLKPEYFFNEFNSVKDSVDGDKEKTFIQKSVNTFANQKTNKLNDNFFFIENNKNIDKQKNEKKIFKYKEYDHQSYKGSKKPHLKERNLPIIEKNNYTEINLEENDNYSNTVAQKICNIIIMGEPKKDKNKKLKSGTKAKKYEKFTKNIEIEENVAQGSAIAKKKINFDINAKKEKPKLLNISPPGFDYDEKKEENVKKEKSSYLEERKKEEIKNFQKKTNEKEKFEKKGEKNFKKIDTNLREKKKLKMKEKEHEIIENEEEIENAERELYERRKQIKKQNLEEEQEIEEDGQIQEPEIEEEQEIEEGQEHFEDENIEQQEQIEQLEDDEEVEDNNNIQNKLKNINNEEGNDGVNKGDIEELEEEEQQQIHVLYNLNDKRNKRIEYKLQKEREIKLDAIKEKKPAMKIEKFQINQKSNNTKSKQKKNNKLKIYYDESVEIISSKKPLILEMNNESNVELISQVEKPTIKIQKVQNFEQPRTIPKRDSKRKSLTIIKNRKNNVEILTKQNKEKQPLIKIEKAENFVQQEIKKKKARNKNIKLKINKINDANFFIEKKEEEKELIIENAENYQIIKNKKYQIKKKKNIKLKINKIKDASFIIEKIEEEPELIIENAENYQIIKDNKKNLKKKNKNIKLKISKIKDANFIIEKNEEEPELIIENTQNYQIIKNKKNQNKKKNKYTKNKISKIKDGDIEIIVTPRLCICNENDIEIKNKYNKKIYKKSNYKKLKQSKRTIYQYKSLKGMEDSISTPKDLRFVIKGKPKKYSKKGRNIIKKEIMYYYKSPISQKKGDLTIGGKIKNTISPTYNNRYYNNNELNNQTKNSNNNIININTYVSNRRKLSSSSTNTNNINQQPNLLERKDEKAKTFKTTTIVSSNLIKNENEPIQRTYQSIRRKYGTSNSNKNILITKVEDNKSNILYLRENISKEKVLKTDTSSNNIRERQMINIISPIKSDRVIQKIEIKNDNNNNSFNIGKNNYSTYKYDPNKNILNQSENNNIGKSKTYFSNRNTNNTKEIPKAQISKETNNNNYNRFKNKSHTITIISNKQESKNIGRTYISSNRLNQSNELIKKEDKNSSNSNIGRIYINTSNLSKKDNDKVENKKMSSSSVNRIYITTNLKKDDKNDKNDKNELINNNNGQNNVYYSSSFRRKKSEPKQFIDNNKLFISSRGTSKDKKNFSNKYEEKTNLNRVMINSYNNSPDTLKNKDKVEINPDQNNLNKITINLDDSSINKDISNNNIETEKNIDNYNTQKDIKKEEQIITNENTKTEEVIDNKKEKEEDKEKKNMDNENEIKKEDNKSIFDLYNIGGTSQLSDITKSYLNSYMTGTRPELSDFSKQFLSSNYTSNSNSRPELSNLTRVYLISQSPVVENEDEK